MLSGGGQFLVIGAYTVLWQIVHHSREEPVPEGLAEEVVQDGVEHTVQHGEALDDLVKEGEHVKGVAVQQGVCAVHGEEEEHNVEGEPAQHKDQDVGVNEKTVPPALCCACRPQLPGC